MRLNGSASTQVGFASLAQCPADKAPQSPVGIRLPHRVDLEATAVVALAASTSDRAKGSAWL